MRAVSPVVASIAAYAAYAAYLGATVAALAGCQDSYASNAQRDTHMGEVQAAAASSTAMSPFAALPPPTPGELATMPVPTPPVPTDAGATKDAAPPHPARGHAKDK